MLAADWNIRFSTFFSWGTALFQQLWCIANAFFRQILLQGCFMECELLWSPMISYRSLLYNTTVLYDSIIYIFVLLLMNNMVYTWGTKVCLHMHKYDYTVDTNDVMKSMHKWQPHFQQTGWHLWSIPNR